jgi:O-antigen/teichoic acid export membrane protein
MLDFVIKKYAFVKSKTPEIFFHSGVIFIFTQIGTLVGALIGIFVIPKYFSEHELGLVTPVTQYVAVGAMPLAVLSSLIVKFVTKYEANQEWGKLKSIVRDLLLLTLVMLTGFALFFVVSFDVLAVRLGIESRILLVLMLIYLVCAGWLPVMMILLRSLRQFFGLAFVALVMPSSLLVLSLVLIPLYGLNGYLIALTFQSLIPLVYFVWLLRRHVFGNSAPFERYFSECGDILKKYLVALIAGGALAWAWKFIPPFVIKHFMTDQDAAGYYFVYKLSFIPSYFVAPVMVVLLPILSNRHEHKTSTLTTVKRTMLFTVVVGFLSTVLVQVASPLFFRYLPSWQAYAAYSKYVWPFALIVILTQLNSVLVTDLIAKWCFQHCWYRLPFSAFFLGATYCLFGWGGTKRFLPDALWLFVDKNLTPGLGLLAVLIICHQLVSLLVSLYWFRKVNYREIFS